MSEIVLHGLKTCDTCRTAIRALEDAGREARLRDLDADPPDQDEVGRWQKILGKPLLNTRSTTWRGLSEADREGDPIDLIVAHPKLVKRPVIETGGELLLGWNDETRSALGL